VDGLSCGPGGRVATAAWYENEYLPAIAAVHEAEFPQAYEHTTKGDIYGPATRYAP
jgi:hypothetical protein